MHLELAWKIVSAWILVLQFDGSFRPPKDPGYPTVAAKMATCAACFFFVSDLHDACDPVTIVLGSRFLPITMDMTSAHAEYEGLLLGLEWLSKHSQSVLSSDYVFSTTTITTPDQTQKLIIQGDCKAVIDQLSGKSISWKLQKEHDQAMKFLNDFSHYFDSIDFDHIPRKENVLSDSLCSNTMLAVESFHYQRCCMVLDGALLLGNEKHQSHHVSSFQRYINSDTSLIRNSLRPFLLSRMLKLAEEHNDYQSMLQIGEYVFTEAKQFTIEKDKEAVWKSTGVANQVNGLRGMGRKKKAAALERKHRILLKSHNAIPLESQNEPVENSVMPWDSTIDEAWLPLLNNWSQHATQQQSWIETNGSTIWSQLHAPISPEED
ncbi:unnamed protein product [Cylindrotheca closterium]|uniref:RNase H type-1 domain-containing protein n=1 Tax=Cylindrotheca closterium TaxID=2856 RepID=A0AAD2CYX5_9STRA|nr:unnamed protein product [Cylindrotheca closterium]